MQLLNVLLAVLAGPLLAAAAENSGELTVLHRLLVPSVDGEDPALFVPRASIDLATRQLTPAPRFHDDLAQFHREARAAHAPSAALYQVALQVAPAAVDGLASGAARLTIASAKAACCHLPLAPADFITIHLDGKGEPFHLDYFLAGVPPSGACPTNKQLQAVDLDRAAFLSPSNTTITFRQPTRPPLPELRVPPPLSPKGELIAPAPEKSFLQKYWMYIAAVLALLLFTGGAPDEEGGRSAGGAR